MASVPGAVAGLRAGDLLHLTRAASIQFVTPITFRLIRVLDQPTYRRTGGQGVSRAPGKPALIHHNKG
ncbi:hypothetical protein GA0070608_2100 [Micromonospora peucetia]|uniref:Uncharacterized protein n=1 Tax=Micromonospora peucetia TaxID=47871 RepID=A0A1C6UZD1_9ACTN|nr:hypothetical protein GA0070608_2100 [Micromonospora peucetia]